MRAAAEEDKLLLLFKMEALFPKRLKVNQEALVFPWSSEHVTWWAQLFCLYAVASVED